MSPVDLLCTLPCSDPLSWLWRVQTHFLGSLRVSPHQPEASGMKSHKHLSASLTLSVSSPLPCSSLLGVLILCSKSDLCVPSHETHLSTPRLPAACWLGVMYAPNSGASVQDRSPVMFLVFCVAERLRKRQRTVFKGH